MLTTPYRRLLAGSLLMLAAGTSPALTLGRAQGAALIGRPLDMSVSVGLDPASDAGDLCAEAEVFYGDGRIEPRRVDLRIATSGDSATARVRVATPVDEAFVTVLLRVGCQQRLSRRYVLLSEQPGDLVEASAATAPLAAQVAPAAPARQMPSAGTPPVASATVNPVAGAPLPTVGQLDLNRPTASNAKPAKPPKPAQRPTTKATPAERQATHGAAQPRSRLKLDAVEARAGTRPAPAAVVPSPAAAPAAPAAPAATPASAAASQPAIAPASSVPTDEAIRNAERLQSMEAEFRAMREAMQRNNTAMAEMRARLERAEGERYANGLVYALGGLLLAVGGLAGFLWWRGRGQGASTRDWWLDTPSREIARPPVAPIAASQDLPSTMSGSEPGSRTTRLEPDRASVLFDVITPAAPMPPVNPADGLRVSDPAPLSSDELSDIQQEADFFMSLGEYDRAIEVLRNHIEAHPQASAVAWLDLLEIHHKLGRREEYEQLRRDFEWLFNARLPSFDDFEQGQQGLEAHAGLLSSIMAAWPGREVLELIDTAIFRRPVDEQGEALGLQAYRDLLFLHHIASEIQSGHPVAPAVRTAIPKPPVVAAPVPAPASAPVDDSLDDPFAQFLANEPASPEHASLSDSPVLDINLDDLESVLPSDTTDDEGSRLLDFEVDDSAQYNLPRKDPNKG